MKTNCTLIILIALTICFSSCVNFGAPIRSESKKITTKLGDVFSVSVQENDFPDQEISIGVSQNNISVYCFSGFANYLSYYDYQNDFVANWYEIIKEYEDVYIKAYRFNWGIIYTTDGGKTYTGVPKHEYENEFADNGVLREMFLKMSQ